MMVFLFKVVISYFDWVLLLPQCLIHRSKYCQVLYNPLQGARTFYIHMGGLKIVVMRGGLKL